MYIKLNYFVYSPTQTPNMNLETAREELIKMIDEMFHTASEKKFYTKYPIDTELLNKAAEKCQNFDDIEVVAEFILDGAWYYGGKETTEEQYKESIEEINKFLKDFIAERD
jgi:hypothetical protein